MGYSSSGTSAGGSTSAGTSLARPVLVGKPSPKTIASPGVIRCGARIHDGGFPLQALPRDVVERGHRKLHFGEDFRWVFVAPREAEPFGQLYRDPKIFARVAGQIERLAAHLHLPVRVCYGA